MGKEGGRGGGRRGGSGGGMLPGEKQRRRKEAIARKRLERSQDRDGLHIDIVDIARQMEEFRLRVLSEQGGDVEEEEGDAGEEHVEPARHAEVEGEQEAAELREEGAVSDGEESTSEESDEEGGGGHEGPRANRLQLPPLSGTNLEFAKKLAGYYRLDCHEKGGGHRKRLTLTMPGTTTEPDEDAVRALLEKYSKIERGAATKRIPTLQHPNEGGFASWEAHTTGFGSRMLMQMGLDMSEAAQQGRRATSLLNSSSRVGIGFGDSLREQE
uniref:G-patch domain-containing protein n=1 Tax=Guillardia theta TaxID=55529 RepID=A0A7S4KTZ3_GUITH|mmetsp:Transcript_31111/g.99840  ORF Transcript_31111/g.99840 Transcript_31111/m.99840 type:complete len:270 (+) Transcript_31111:136-945(+)